MQLSRGFGKSFFLRDVVSTSNRRCFDVESTLFRRRFDVDHRRGNNVTFRRRRNFQFQPNIDVVSTLINDVVSTLFRRACAHLVVYTLISLRWY